MSNEVATPKIEQVEYWSLVGNNGVSVMYMLRVERNERANIMLNEIDHSPIEVQLLLRTEDDENKIAATLSFPVCNLFSYGKENGTFAVYPKGFSPTDKAIKDDADKRAEGMVTRKRRMEAILGRITDLYDGTAPKT